MRLYLKLLYLPIFYVSTKNINNKIIKNIDIPSCKNCVYFKPSYFDKDFSSSLTKCHKFGTKNIINDEINYDYADSCRNDNNKCGIEGKFFEKENNINLKILIHKLISSLPYIILVSSLILSFLVNIYITKNN